MKGGNSYPGKAGGGGGGVKGGNSYPGKAGGGGGNSYPGKAGGGGWRGNSYPGKKGGGGGNSYPGKAGGRGENSCPGKAGVDPSPDCTVTAISRGDRSTALSALTDCRLWIQSRHRFTVTLSGRHDVILQSQKTSFF